ncbi:MAG: DUF4474 domain-containing protein [Bacilli bacterium]
MLETIINIIIESPYIIFSSLILLIFFIFYYSINLGKRKIFKFKKYNSLLKPLNVEELNKEIKQFGFAYDPFNDIFFSLMNPWQREFGYCKSYDEAAPLFAMIIDCEPIYFKYNNRNWLIEFWKGQYGITTGGEIGLYVSNQTNDFINYNVSEIFYDSVQDNELILMSYTLKKQNKVLIKRKAKHWWLTGFKLGEFTNPSKLIMNITLTLKDNKMRDAVITGLRNSGYKNIGIFNDTLYLIFKKPHTKKPFTRNLLISFFMLNYNRLNCSFYKFVTRKQQTSLDKINYIRSKFPLLYEKILNFEKNKNLYRDYGPKKT